MNVEIRKLVKKFGGIRAVDTVDLRFEMGKITALIGPNGSGKTTLINTITGLLTPDGGEISLGGRRFSSIPPHHIARMGIARTFQNSRLTQQVSVLENVSLALGRRGMLSSLLVSPDRCQTQAEEVLRRVGLLEMSQKKAEELSFGQRKLLEIGRALATKAACYFFDEPFSGLFPAMVEKVKAILLELKDKGATVVLIEHDMALVRSLADHCYVLDSGKVIAEGAPESVLREPHVVEAYLGK